MVSEMTRGHLEAVRRQAQHEAACAKARFDDQKTTCGDEARQRYRQGVRHNQQAARLAEVAAMIEAKLEEK